MPRGTGRRRGKPPDVAPPDLTRTAGGDDDFGAQVVADRHLECAVIHIWRQIMASRILSIGAIAGLALGLALPAAQGKTAGKTVELKDVKGQSVGTATLSEKGSGVQ